jgi:glycosyltransferase involved in cell wall biosynthesis
MAVMAGATRFADTSHRVKMTTMPHPLLVEPVCRVSVVIKALNEENGIEATIQSALHAVSNIGGEVVLADSCSTDRTVEFAMRFPIRIVQLSRAEERCCGVGPQLGYQHSFGQFIYILDGDMKLVDGFVEEAIAILEAQPNVAGVGGRVVELNTDSLEYIAREAKANANRKIGIVDRLDGGGLYRRTAIESAGYFSDRNLHSYEEYDLATRLRTLDWKLIRIDSVAATHFGHDAPPYDLLMRRWRSRYVCGLGELIRAAVGQPRFLMLLKGISELRLYLAVLLWWVLLVAILLSSITPMLKIAAFLSVMLAPLLLMIWRKKSLVKASYAVVSWCFQTAGLVRGVVANRRPPCERIASKILREPVMSSSSTV